MLAAFYISHGCPSKDKSNDKSILSFPGTEKGHLGPPQAFHGQE